MSKETDNEIPPFPPTKKELIEILRQQLYAEADAALDECKERKAKHGTFSDAVKMLSGSYLASALPFSEFTFADRRYRRREPRESFSFEFDIPKEHLPPEFLAWFEKYEQLEEEERVLDNARDRVSSHKRPYAEKVLDHVMSNTPNGQKLLQLMNQLRKDYHTFEKQKRKK